MTKLPDGYEIRLATNLDIPALIAADRAASELFRPTGLIPDMAAIPQSIPADTLAEGIENGMLLTATSKSGPVGFGLCQQYEERLYLHQLSVDPAHGRKGLGGALVRYVFALAEDKSCGSITLSTFRDIPWNGPFYAKLGFREIPRKKMTKWMLAVEAAQAETLDVTQRCFMRRPVRKSLLARMRWDERR